MRDGVKNPAIGKNIRESMSKGVLVNNWRNSEAPAFFVFFPTHGIHNHVLAGCDLEQRGVCNGLDTSDVIPAPDHTFTRDREALAVLQNPRGVVDLDGYIGCGI